MAPRTAGGLARGMAHGGHIRHENYEFIGVKGPPPASIFSHGPDLHSGDLDSMVHGGHTLRTALGGYILECTHVRVPLPSLITGHGRDLHLRNQTAMAHGDLTQGMDCGGPTLFGNHKITRTDGATPVICSYPVQAHRVEKLDPMT